MFFVTSMLRSGSTFLARTLNSNKAIACASDPVFPYFKALRNKLINRSIDHQAISDLSSSKEKRFLRALKIFDFQANLDGAITKL